MPQLMMECHCTTGSSRRCRKVLRATQSKRKPLEPMRAPAATPVKAKKTARVARGVATNNLVFSAYAGTNDEVFPNVLKLYVPAGSKIADITFGQGVFWKKVEKGAYNVRRPTLKSGSTVARYPTTTHRSIASFSIHLTCTLQEELLTKTIRTSSCTMSIMARRTRKRN